MSFAHVETTRVNRVLGFVTTDSSDVPTVTAGTGFTVTKVANGHFSIVMTSRKPANSYLYGAAQLVGPLGTTGPSVMRIVSQSITAGVLTVVVKAFKSEVTTTASLTALNFTAPSTINSSTITVAAATETETLAALSTNYQFSFDIAYTVATKGKG